MIVSGVSSCTEYQRYLWDRPLGNHGSCRVIIGNLIEDLTAVVFNGKRHRCTGAADYCPDVSAKGRYYECKAMGRSRQTFIYQGRLEKDRRFVDVGHELYYVVWHHTATTKGVATIEGLEALVLTRIQWCAVMPFDYVEAVCLSRKAVPINSKYGKSNKDGTLYGIGYRVPVRCIEPWIVLEWRIAQADACLEPRAAPTNLKNTKQYTFFT